MGFLSLFHSSSIYSGKVQENPQLCTTTNLPATPSPLEVEITILHSVPPTSSSEAWPRPSFIPCVSITTAYLLIKVICCPVPSILLRISSYPRGDRWTVIQLDTITGLATPHLHIWVQWMESHFNRVNCCSGPRSWIFGRRRRFRRAQRGHEGDNGVHHQSHWRILYPSSVPLVFALSL